MKRLLVLCLLTSLGCSKTSASEGQANAQEAVPAVSVVAAAAASPSAAAASPRSGAAQRFSGKLSVTRKTSATTKKGGAPTAWEKDDGQKFAGEAELALTVGGDGQVEGTLKGALGERTLRGHLDGEVLTAQLVPAGDDATQIQNGTLSLKRQGAGFKGQLVAATGDALILRQGDVLVAAAQGS